MGHGVGSFLPLRGRAAMRRDGTIGCAAVEHSQRVAVTGGLRGEMVYRRAFQEFFVEAQRYGRAGGFDSHVQVSAGLLLARPLFH